MADTYDVVVIGSGPGGYVCAIKAAQLGLKTAVVEKNDRVGGTCLNIGCIPSKALLHASELFHVAGHELEAFGVETAKPTLNLKTMMRHKDEVVDANVKGVEFLFKKNKIDLIHGTGKVLGEGRLSVIDTDGKNREFSARNIVLATGSTVAGIKGVPFEYDEKIIVSSTGALSLKKVPEHLVVVGAGVIGLELGSVWARLGAKVTIVEYLDRILAGMDADVAHQAQRILAKQGMNFHTGAKVTALGKKGKSAEVTMEPVAGGKSETIAADVVLVSTGRKAFTDGLGLDEAGIEQDEAGRIRISGNWQSSLSGVYAIGDVVSGPMLAHKAEDEGIAVAEIIAGQAGHVNYNVIPSVVYTQPEIASVGASEEELKSSGVDYKTGKFPFTANARARAMRMSDGFVKILSDRITDRVVGVHIVGFGAGELIHEAAVLMEFGGSSEDLARTCHAHPTMSEAVREAALATFAKPIHM